MERQGFNGADGANKVRIQDIADELGVSTATVSNVIHGKTKKISDRTVKMVQLKLEERKYIPNMAATLLAQNNSRIIGVVVNDHEKYEGNVLNDPFISLSINELSAETENKLKFMMVKKTTEIWDVVQFASMWNLDGMVLIGFCEAQYQELRDQIHIPFVVYDGFFENKDRICNLTIDDFDGGCQVGVHFRILGHERVLCVADNCVCMDRLRYEGLCEGLMQRADFWQIPLHKEERLAFYEERFDALREFTAIFAVSDFYAVELMHFLQEKGIDIPKDISIAGFDGSPLCGQVTPTLTSVHQNSRSRAVMALNLLQHMKENMNFKDDVLLPVRLVTRGSTAGRNKNRI